MLDQFLICWEVDKASLALMVLHVLVRHFGKAGWQWNEVKSELPLLKLQAFPGFVSLLALRSAFSIGRKIRRMPLKVIRLQAILPLELPARLPQGPYRAL
jgi:hypothetical protein